MIVVRYVILLILVLVALVDDYKRYKISNRIIVSGLLVACVMCAAEMCMLYVVNKNNADIMYGGYRGYKETGLMYMSGMVLAFVIGYVLYMVKAIGAGDVKLFGVAGMLIGSKDVVYLIGVSLAAGVFTGIIEILRKKETVLVTGRSMHKFHFSYAIMQGVCIVVCLKLTGIVS